MCPERIQPFPRHFPTTRWERAAYGDSHLQHRLIAQALTAELESLDIAKLACSSSRTLAHLQSEGRVVGDYRETVDRDGNSYAAKQSPAVKKIIHPQLTSGLLLFAGRGAAPRQARALGLEGVVRSETEHGAGRMRSSARRQGNSTPVDSTDQYTIM